MIPDVSPLLSVLFLAAVVAGVYMLLLAAGWLVAWHRERERLRVDREWAEIQRARAALARLHQPCHADVLLELANGGTP